MRENGVLDWEVSKKNTAFLVAIKTHFNAVLIVGPAHLPANSLRGGYDDGDAGDEKGAVPRVRQLADFRESRRTAFSEPTRELGLACEAHTEQRHPISLHLRLCVNHIPPTALLPLAPFRIARTFLRMARLRFRFPPVYEALVVSVRRVARRKRVLKLSKQERDLTTALVCVLHFDQKRKCRAPIASSPSPVLQLPLQHCVYEEHLLQARR